MDSQTITTDGTINTNINTNINSNIDKVLLLYYLNCLPWLTSYISISQTSVQVVTEYLQETDYTILTTTKHSQSIRVIQIWKVQYYIRSHSPSSRHVVKCWKPKINIMYLTHSFGIKKSTLVATHIFFYLKITVVSHFVVKIISILCFHSLVVPLLPWRYLNTNNYNYDIHWLDNEELN